VQTVIFSQISELVKSQYLCHEPARIDTTLAGKIQLVEGTSWMV